ncbi:MAG: permease [Rhodobacter sp. CACIA14H1]|nr:MAG: permease [Rhodobacter sp. CACIA14H1]
MVRPDKPFLVLGRAGMDLYADPPGTRTEEAARFTTALGGSSANIAAALTRQGARAALLSCLSDDAIGRFVLNELARYGIDRTHVHLTGGESRSSLALVETRLENTQSVIYRNNAADFALSQTQVESVDFTAYSALVATGTALAAEPSRGATFLALARARAAGLPVILDIDHRPYSWPSQDEARRTCAAAAECATMVVGNDVEFALLSGHPDTALENARTLAAQGKTVIFKMGEEGAITLWSGTEIRSGIFRTTALKPTGAGDAFLGTLLAALTQGHPLPRAVIRGSAAAAMVVARVGCAPAMPTVAELDHFLATHHGPTE